MLLRVEDLNVGYGKHHVLKTVSLTAQEEEIVGIFGHNGAGKSTLLKAIFGLVPVKSGRVLFDNEDKTQWGPFMNNRHGIGFVLQEKSVFPNLSVLDNLRLGSYSLDNRATVRKKIDEILDIFPVLAKRKNSLGRLLSGGERQMLAISLVLINKPKLMLLDEPSFGLAPLIVMHLFEVIQDINAKLSSSILLVEQNVKEALKLASRVYVMKEGKFTYEGSGQDSERIMRAIWGV